MYLETRKRKAKRGDVVHVLELAVRRSVREPGKENPGKETVLQLPRVRFSRPDSKRAYPKVTDRVAAWHDLAEHVENVVFQRIFDTPEGKAWDRAQSQWARALPSKRGAEPVFPSMTHIEAAVREEYAQVIGKLAQAIGKPSPAEVDHTYGGQDDKGDIREAWRERGRLERAFGESWWP